VKKMWLAIVLFVVVAALAVAGCQAVRAGYESAPYRVVRADGKFELRDYPALTVAETPLGGTGGGDNGSFMRLFRFIGGSNQAQQKISMTTPVFMSGSGTNATMAFVMPAKLETANVPRPADPRVQVRAFEAGRFAVLRFSGRRSPANEAKARERLQQWMQAEGLKALSPPVYAYFDPPWTPSFLRRNEVMIQTESGQ
jgi:DNA gyrase inhibitor GyrI